MKKFLVLVVALFAISVHQVNASAQVKPAATPVMAPAPAMAPVTMAAPVAPAPMTPVMAPVAAPMPAPMEVAMSAPMEAAKPVPMEAAKAIEKPMEKAKEKVKKSAWATADTWIGRIVKVILALLGLVGLILGWSIGNGWKKSQRLKKALEYADKAFPTVEALAKKTGWKGDDKLVQLLQRVSDWLKAEGEFDLNEEEIAVIKKDVADKAAALKAEEKDQEVSEEAVKRG